MITLKCKIMKAERKKLWMTAIAALFLAVIIGGCKKDNFKEITGVCPLVASTDPANGATGVHFDKIITATFNEKMNPATITQASFTIQGAASAAKSVTYTDIEELN